MTKSKATLAAEAAERDEARATLREIFPVGSTATTVRKHTSGSGMFHVIAVLTPSAHDDGVRDVSHLVARATGDKYSTRHGGVEMGGTGMDMGFALVYGLARALYRDGFPCIGGGPDYDRNRTRCPSNDHTNERGADADWTPGRMHSDPGYALQHRWA